MRNWILSVSLLACVAMFAAFLCQGCGSEKPEESETDKSEPNAVVDPVVEGVAVTVNGVDIFESEIEKIIKPDLDRLADKTKYMPAGAVEEYTRQFREHALEQLIRRVLLDGMMKQANIEIPDEAVMSQIEEIASKQGMSVDEFAERMKQYGHTLEGIKKEIREGLARNQFMAAQWEGKISVAEDDAKKYYDENPEEFKVPEQIRASHILITPATTGDPNDEKAKARTKIEGLLAQIKDGADFAELAKANSSCPSAADGGDLNFFPRGKTTPAFEKVAFELEVGELSDVVETDYGFHIIKVTDHTDPTVVSFEQAGEQIIKSLTEAKQIEFADEYLKKLRAEAEIVYPSNT
jgi:peptidyl-prolyl cis-trans isomerase C